MSLSINFILFIALLVLVVQRLRTLLTYFQQEEYDQGRFLQSCFRVRLHDIRATAAILAGNALLLLGANQTLVLGALVLLLIAITYFERQHRYKKPLVMTDRAWRIFIAAAALCGVSAVGVFVHPIFAVIPLQIGPLALVLTNAALQPYQNRINKAFIDEARVKLNCMNPTRIGITGSFGKTTVKHMLSEILEASAPTYYSRGSINTVLGHTRHIRERLQWSHKYFVAEMGAYGIGSIKNLCKFIQPDYGIVTAVGDAHTERFGSIDAIASAKSELVEAVCQKDGLVVINAAVLDFGPFRTLKDKHPTHILSVGRNDADVLINANEVEGGSWMISLSSSDPRIKDIDYLLPLLGEHNVMNSALAVTLAQVLDDEILDQIPHFTKTISQVPHRLQKLDASDAALILDDAYNSNEQGFMSAVASLEKLAAERGGRAILVTPGIAELGLEHNAVHARLGGFSSGKCDAVYVINPDRIESFTSAIDTEKSEVIKVSTLAQARIELSKILRDEDVVLYENDLPDLLEERRLL